MSLLSSDSVHYGIRLHSDYRVGATIFRSISPLREGGPSSHGALASCARSEAIGQRPSFVPLRSCWRRGRRLASPSSVLSLLRLPVLPLSKLPPPFVRDDGCGRGDRRPLRSPTNCAKAPQASAPRPPPLASLSSCLHERLSSLRGVSDRSPNRRDQGRSGRSSPGAYAKHLVALLGDAFLGIALSRPIGSGHQPQVVPSCSRLGRMGSRLYGDAHRRPL